MRSQSAMAAGRQGRAGQDIVGTPEVNEACYRAEQTNGKRTFSDVTICNLKLSKFESSYRCNATETSAWVYYIPTYHIAKR